MASENQQFPQRSSDIDVEKGLVPDPQTMEEEQPQSIFNRKTIGLLFIMMIFKIQTALNSFAVRGAFPYFKAEFHPMPENNFIMKAVCSSSFVLSTIPFSILADHHSRKHMMCAGLIFQIFVTIASSIVPNELFGLFLVMRALSNIADACCAPIIGNIILDIVDKKKRFWLQAFLQLSVPIGSGIGYVITYQILGLMGLDWRWSLRFAQVLSFFTLLQVIIFMEEPPRRKTSDSVPQVNFLAALKVVCKTRILLYSLLGSAFMPFIARGIEIWAYAYMHHAREMLYKDQICSSLICLLSDKILVKILSSVASMFGLVIGSLVSLGYQNRNPHAEPIMCVGCLLISAPLLAVSLLCREDYPVYGYILLWFTEMQMSTATVINSNIRMSVTAPEIRSSAKALYLISTTVKGQLANTLYFYWVDKEIALQMPSVPAVQRVFYSLQYDLMIYPCVAVLGSGFYAAISHSIK